MFIEIIFAFLFFKFTGLTTLFSNPNFLAAGIEQKLPALDLLFQNNLVAILFYFFIFGITSFILGASLNSMRFSMIRDVVLNEKYNFKKVLHCGIRFWPIVFVRMILFGLGIVAFLFITGAYMILQSYCSVASTLLIITVLIILAVFFLRLLFLFAYAIMFFEKKGAFYSVKKSFSYFFKNKRFTFAVFLIVIVFSAALIPFELAFTHYEGLFGIVSFYAILSLILRYLASTFYNVWSEVLIFYYYHTKELSPSGPLQQQSP
jgi:hypothetical protein